jgi:TonB family protein
MVKLLFPLLLAACLAAQEPYKIGDGVSAPVPIFKLEPAYTQEAKDAKLQGSLLLAIVIDSAGKVSEPKVMKTRLVYSETGAEASNDLGLGAKALECIVKWRFKPGSKDGKAVPVRANVEVNFRLD